MLEVPELNLEILYNLALPELLNICATNRYYQEVCDNIYFWQQKIQRDFKFIPAEPNMMTYTVLYYLDLILAGFQAEMPPTKVQKDIIRTLYQQQILQNNIIEDHSVSSTNQSEMLHFISLALAEDGYIDALQYLEHQGLQLQPQLAEQAEFGGHINILDWLAQRNIYPGQFAGSLAAREGHVEVLEWLWEHHIPIDENALVSADRSGHVNVLEWLWNHGYGHNENITKEAAKNAVLYNQLASLEWLASKGIYPAHYRYALIYNYSNIINWMLQQGIPPEDYNIIVKLYNKGYITAEQAKAYDEALNM